MIWIKTLLLNVTEIYWKYKMHIFITMKYLQEIWILSFYKILLYFDSYTYTIWLCQASCFCIEIVWTSARFNYNYKNVILTMCLNSIELNPESILILPVAGEGYCGMITSQLAFESLTGIPCQLQSRSLFLNFYNSIVSCPGINIMLEVFTYTYMI